MRVGGCGPSRVSNKFLKLTYTSIISVLETNQHFTIEVNT